MTESKFIMARSDSARGKTKPEIGSDYPVETWQERETIQAMEFAEYWNDEDIERQKDVFWILDGNFEKMEAYLEARELPLHLSHALAFINTELGRTLEGSGADLAAGSLWAVPRLLDAGQIEKIYAVEYSNHRLLTLGPKLLKHYEVPLDRIVLCLGSFYDLHLPDASLDFIFLSQAFHHAAEPDRLLAEMRRVLKVGGLVIMIGEHVVQENSLTVTNYVWQGLKYILSRLIPTSVQRRMLNRQIAARTFLPALEPLKADSVLGDHYYRLNEYARMFGANGFTHYSLRMQGSGYQSFVLTRED